MSETISLATFLKRIYECQNTTVSCIRDKTLIGTLRLGAKRFTRKVFRIIMTLSFYTLRLIKVSSK